MSTTTDWLKLAEAFKAGKRPLSGYFTWEADRSVEEEGVLIAFARALQEQGQLFFERAFHRGEGNDPPDCEAIGKANERIGIEVTELVDPPSAAAARAQEPYSPKHWTDEDIVAGLQQRISAKDAGNPKDGPFDDYVVLIYTDEPGISAEAARKVASTHVFDGTNLINEAYLLMSYDSVTRSHPCLKLKLGHV